MPLPVVRVADVLPATVANVAGGLINRQFGPKAQFTDVTGLTLTQQKSISAGILYITQAEWDAMA